MSRKEMIIIVVFAFIMALIAWVLTPIAAHAATVQQPVANNPLKQTNAIIIIKKEAYVAVTPSETLEGLAKLGAHHCEITFLSANVDALIQGIWTVEQSGVKIGEWVKLTNANAKPTEIRGASAFGNVTVYGVRMQISKGPGKSWLKANVIDRVVPFAISSLTGSIFGGIWGDYGRMLGINQLLNPNNIYNSIIP